MSDELRRRFAIRLKQLLEENGKTQADLARYMHVSTGTASEWVNGQKLPRVDKMEEIAAWLGTTIHSMIPRSESYMSVSGMLVTDPDEQEVVVGYRNADDLEKAMVRRTLGIDKKGNVGQAKDSFVS